MKQKSLESRFKILQKLSLGLRPVYNKTFLNTNGISKANAFFKMNVPIVEIVPVINEFSEYKEWLSCTMKVDYSKVILSNGNITVPVNTRYRLRKESLFVLDVRWSFVDSTFGNADDLVYLVAFCPDVSDSIHTYIERSMKQLSIFFPPAFLNHKVHVYMFATNSNVKQFSPTVYIGAFLPESKDAELSYDDLDPYDPIVTHWSNLGSDESISPISELESMNMDSEEPTVLSDSVKQNAIAPYNNCQLCPD
jgi:hypothetical protein